MHRKQIDYRQFWAHTNHLRHRAYDPALPGTGEGGFVLFALLAALVVVAILV